MWCGIENQLGRRLTSFDLAEALARHVEQDDASLYIEDALDQCSEVSIPSEDWKVLCEEGEIDALSVFSQAIVKDMAWDMACNDEFEKYAA